MKNKLTGIVGCALACVAAQVVVNLIAYGSAAKLGGSAVIGLVLGTVIGAIIAAVGSNRPVITGLITTSAIYAAMIVGLAMLNVTAITSVFTFVLVAVTVVVIGLANGFGYKLLGPKTN